MTAPTLAAPNVMLMGPSGSGKTYAIGTLVDSGIEVFYLGVENGLESLMGYYTDRKLPLPANLHWHIVDAPKASMLELLDIATKVNTLGLESLSKMVDPNRQKHDQFIKVLKALNDFADERTGEAFGSVDTWGVDRALVIDGLTGLNLAAMSTVVGGKPVKSMPDWGLAQQLVETLLRKLCDACPCWFVLIAHVERETDQVLGGIKIMASTLGKALAPKLPAMFSDVVLTKRGAGKWNWDTDNPQADLKTRNLEWKSDLPPSFAPIVQKWRARSGG